MITFSSNGAQVILRSAEFGDGYRIHLGLNYKRAMDGTPFCTIQTPPRKVHFFSINRMNTPKRWELEKFIKDSAGNQIIITFDYPESEAPITVTTRLIGQPFESVHQGVRNTIASFEYEEVNF